MPIHSDNWRVHYPRRTPHSRRPRVRMDTVVRRPAAETRPNLARALSYALPIHEKAGSSSRLAQRGENIPKAAAGDALGRRIGTPTPTDTRAVRFDSVIKLILVPTRNDLDGLSAELWWQEEDYAQFRLGAGKEESARELRKPMQTPSSPMESTRNKQAHPPPAEIARALQIAGHASSMGLTRQFKLSVPPLTGPRLQPPTPPTSPVNSSGVVARLDESPSESPGPLPKDEWSYVEDYDGFVSLGGLPRSGC